MVKRTQDIAAAPPTIEDIAYFDPIVGSYILDEPPTLLIGQECGARCNGWNNSATYIYLSLDVTSYDPFGNSLTGGTIGPVRIAPGESLGIHQRELLVYPGTYRYTFELFVGENWATRELVDIVEKIPVAYATGEIPPLEGHLYSPFIHDITDNESYYSLLVEIPSGHEVIAGVRFKNDGELAVFTARVELVDPDGSVRISGVANRELDTSEGSGVQTGSSVKLDKEGIWEIRATLRAEGTLLDAQTWDAIGASAPPQEFQGTITEKTLRYDSSEAPIPASDVPVDFYEGLVIIRGKNDTSENQRMGVHWVVKDPDGLVVDNYTHWEHFWTGPGLEQGFIHQGGAFALDKKGVYSLYVELLMNSADPVTVDSYDGTLCSTDVEIPPEYTLIHHTIYPFAYIYDGKVDIVTATFKTDPFTPSSWMGEQFASKLEEEARADGHRVIEVKVYVDVSPIFWKNFIIEITTLATESGTSKAVGSPGWPAVIIAALLIIGIIVAATILVKTIMSAFRHYPGLHEVKPGWGKETLIMAIQDSEEYWERPPTPESTLQAMSEPELRDLLDQVADEELGKGGIPMWLWIAGGAVGAVAVVAVVKGATRK